MVWPESVNNLFPAIAIFYRPTKPKLRKGRISHYERTGKFNNDARLHRPIEKVKAVYKPLKKRRTREGNLFSFMSVLLMSPDDFGTARRSMKHKGFSKFVALVYATHEEIESEKHQWRYRFFKYRTANELYAMRKVWDSDFKNLCDRLDEKHITKSSGQVRLI